MTDFAVPRMRKRFLQAPGIAALLAFTAGFANATPAEAGDARCATASIDCGVIYNTSDVNIRIATNFSPTYSDNVGTVSGVTATLGSQQNSNRFKDSSGRFYDWDAVYVPPKSCIFTKVGPGLGTHDYYRNPRDYGVWYKVNNLGANVRGLRSC
ncbi:hypothetical protein ACO03V_02545 [Microbacterium sp. HMH0099]|uniref:hypothetical protein n=1 Tax=Microbacterium sp. HMH0099 TaxID=3414026 RepID=UPI003BF6BE29